MGRAATPTSFRRDFCQRLKSARVMAGYSQAEAAEKLGLLLNTYNKYETRTMLPHHLVQDVCDLYGIEAAFLFTGERAARRKTA